MFSGPIAVWSTTTGEVSFAVPGGGTALKEKGDSVVTRMVAASAAQQVPPRRWNPSKEIVHRPEDGRDSMVTGFLDCKGVIRAGNAVQDGRQSLFRIEAGLASDCLSQTSCGGGHIPSLINGVPSLHFRSLSGNEFIVTCR